MRILILSSEFPPGPGGVGTHAYQIARVLHQNGNEVLILSPQDYANQSEIDLFNRQQDFNIVQLKRNRIYLLTAFHRLRKVYYWLRKWSPEIILASGEKSVWMISLLAKSIPWVAVGHGTEFGRQIILEKIITRWAFNQASGVICVSRYTCGVMHQLGISPKNEYIISNGADEEMFYPDDSGKCRMILKDIGVDDSSVILLTVGNVTRRKGQEVVIQAMPIILKRFPKTVYLIVGLPTERSRLEQLSYDLGVQKQVRFLGRMDNEQLRMLYQACDVFLMTSQNLTDGNFEGFGISVIEAALCGKPAIVSSGAGLEEAVSNGITGIWVPERDPDNTAGAVITLLEQPGLRRRMGEEALKRARSGYTWKIVGLQYRKILEDLLRNKRLK